MHTRRLGESLTLSCEFRATHFNLFDNPVLWKKKQVCFPSLIQVPRVLAIADLWQINWVGNIIGIVLTHARARSVSYSGERDLSTRYGKNNW